MEPVIAQSLRSSTPADSAQGSSDTASLQEVTVTAQRRKENSQRVPVTVDTLSADVAQDRGADSVQSLATTIPNLTFTTAQYGTNTYIRGVGDNSGSPNNEPSAAVYIDGVYDPSGMALTSFSFNNIERIEVLKGPQGTLFGRNATAGVIQIITPDPKHDFGGKVDVGYGNYQTSAGDVYLTGGLTDKLAADLALLYDGEDQGYGRNLTFDVPTFRHKNLAARSKWLYDLSDATAIRFAVDYAKYDSDGTPNHFVLGSFGPYVGRYNAQGNPSHDNTKEYSASVRVDQDFGAVLHGVSITSYRNASGDQFIDSDNLPAYNSELFQAWDSHYVTQELQLTNRDPGRLTWLVGAFYYGNVVGGADPRIQTGAQIAGQYREYFGTSHTDSGSVFGQATAELFAGTHLTLGLRYTDETLKADGRTLNSAGQIITNGGPFAQSFASKPLTWRVALDHQFTPDVLGYVSFNRGFKSGGYNLSSPGSAPFFPEHVDAYEIGVKSEFLDHRVRLNLAGFYYDYTDIQVAIILGGAQLFTNAAAARNYGLDGSLDFAATDHLTLSAGLGLLSAKYEDYPGARGYTPFGVAINIANAKGADLPFAPPITGFVSGDYRVPTPIGTFKVAANLSYNDRSYVTPDQQLARPAYFMLNSSVEWRSPADGSLSVRLWGKNLTNAEYFVFATESATGWYAADGPPRTYGLSVEKDFQ
jgi:iron complex outermembrane receptor protein